MPNRHGQSEGYRYGYQGSEKDDEVHGQNGSSYTTHFRQLDVRIGRWLSIDPKATAWESPYVSMGDNPVWFNDVLGDKVEYAGKTKKEKKSNKAKVQNALKNDTEFKKKFLKLKNSSETFVFNYSEKESNFGFDGKKFTINFNNKEDEIYGSKDVALKHEITHGVQFLEGKVAFANDGYKGENDWVLKNYDAQDEIEAIDCALKDVKIGFGKVWNSFDKIDKYNLVQKTYGNKFSEGDSYLQIVNSKTVKNTRLYMYKYSGKIDTLIIIKEVKPIPLRKKPIPIKLGTPPYIWK